MVNACGEVTTRAIPISSRGRNWGSKLQQVLGGIDL
jgi:hypothetical protein